VRNLEREGDVAGDAAGGQGGEGGEGVEAVAARGEVVKEAAEGGGVAGLRRGQLRSVCVLVLIGGICMVAIYGFVIMGTALN